MSHDNVRIKFIYIVYSKKKKISSEIKYGFILKGYL